MGQVQLLSQVRQEVPPLLGQPSMEAMEVPLSSSLGPSAPSSSEAQQLQRLRRSSRQQRW